jgi:hypothetical protein
MGLGTKYVTDKQRSLYDFANRAPMLLAGAGGVMVAIPALTVTAPSWAPVVLNNLILTSGRYAALNVAGGVGDLTYQVLTKKNIGDVNGASVASNLFLGPVPSAVIGSTLNLSYNGIRTESWLQMPTTSEWWFNTAAGTFGNYVGGKGADFLGPFNPALGVGANMGGNAISDKIIEVSKE